MYRMTVNSKKSSRQKDRKSVDKMMIGMGKIGVRLKDVTTNSYVTTNEKKSYFTHNTKNLSTGDLHQKIKSAINTPKNVLSISTNSTSSSNFNTHQKMKSPKHPLKQNFYSSLFQTTTGTPCKNSATSTPFHQKQQRFKQVEKRKPSRASYNFIYQIGSGGFGSVWKVKHKQTQQVLAMKQISKAKVIMKKSVTSVINEKQLLDQMSNPFIINAVQSFQDRQNLYLTMEYLRGGDLRYHLCYYDQFDEKQTKFIAACIIESLGYIHQKGIIHRDLKPENLVFQENGYLRLTDFGVARKKKANNSQQTSGTPGYMSPEVICRMNHSYQSDLFALGVIIYEIIMGKRPYMGDSRKQIRDKILAHQAKISAENLPQQWNTDCVDFVNRLLKRNKQSRLGYNGIEQIKNHPWLRSINWKKLAQKQLLPPFSPGVVSQSLQYQKQMQNSECTELDEETIMLLRTDQIQNLFKQYENNESTPKKSGLLKVKKQMR